MSIHDYYHLVINGESDSGQEITLDQSDLILGRDPGTDVVIESPGVSRQHARIFFQDGLYVIEDLNSSNGTFVNEQQITAPAHLQPEDRIRLGKLVEIVFRAPAVQSEEIVESPAYASDELSATMLADDSFDLAQTAIPPQLSVTIAGDETQDHTLTRDVITIGRADDNDIVVPSKIVSRYHGRLERVSGGYAFVPLPEAGNPVLFQGRSLLEQRRLQHDDVLRIGSQDPGTMVTMVYTSPAEATAQGKALNIDFGEDTVLSIGRDPSNDVVLDAPQISRYHAQIERIGQRFRVRDLRSSNGIFVNDQRLEGETWLKTDDVVRIGPYRFVLGDDELAQFDETGGLRVEVLGLNKWVREDLNILQDISLVFQPREFIVVVGQSGGGKSTLIDAIAGYRPATHGKVLVNGINVYQNFDAIRSEIGFVPQKDIIHMELTVYQALDYAAQLRMPPDTTKEERHQRVLEVLEDLDLVHRKDVQISGLSGGQQKRVSIGVELLTKPGLFFLDEPTSGLDPGTETALMHLMRRLADQGRTIILITHATKNVMLADKVVFLARGGYLAWFGPPNEALEYFDQYRSERERRASSMEFDDIYAILDNPANGSAEEWAERYRNSAAYRHYVYEPLQDSEQELPQQPVTAEIHPDEITGKQQKTSLMRQFRILSARNLKILTRDRFSLILMLAAAPLVGLLDVLLAFLLGRAPFDYYDGDVFNGIITLFILPLYGIMVGALATMREIVKENDIYKRERLVNLKIAPYVLSKVWIAVILALYQAAAYVIIRYLAFKMPGTPLDFLLIYITMFMATLAGTMLGLFSSALAPNANSVPLIVILFVLPQIVLGGALIPLPAYVNAPISSRWGFQGMMGVVGVGSDIVADTCWALPKETRLQLTAEDKADLGCPCMGANLLNPESCFFPSIGQFYTPTLDQDAPQEPPPLRPEPERPVLPERPQEPEDQSDNVAMATFFEELQAWEDQVNEIQANYEAEVELYRADAEVYQAAMVDYQTRLAEFTVAQQASIQPAEALVDTVNEDFGWTFVDKRNQAAYIGKIALTWLAQVIISLVLFGGILFFQKRKDMA